MDVLDPNYDQDYCVSPKKKGVLKQVTSMLLPKRLIEPVKRFASNIPVVEEESSVVQVVSSTEIVPEERTERAPVFDAEAYEREQRQSVELEMQALKQRSLDEVEAEIEGLKKAAEESGYKVGSEKGEGQFLEQSQALLAAINQLGVDKKEDLNGRRDFVMELAMAIASSVVQRELKSDPGIFEQLFQQAFDKITDKDRVTIEVNPSDKGMVDAFKEKFSEAFKDITVCDIKENADIAQGGCTIETNLGYIDATIGSKIALLTKALERYHQDLDKVDESPAPKQADVSAGPESEPEPKSQLALGSSSQPELEPEQEAEVEQDADESLDFDDDDDDDDDFDDFDFDDDDDF